MSTKHAAMLDNHELNILLDRVMEDNPEPEIMRVAFMLSYYAGLRVQEIAGLRWSRNVMAANGKVQMHEYPLTDGPGEFLRDNRGRVVVEKLPTLFIGSDINKYTGERNIPMHPSLKKALDTLYEKRDHDVDWVIPSGKKGASKTLAHRAHALRMRINRVYKSLGLDSCTSHSGRRSYITRGARLANANGASIRDIQAMAGHKNIKTTQAYIDENLSGQARTTEAMWN